MLKELLFPDIQLLELEISANKNSYNSCTFYTGQKLIEFRTAKVTPIKTGQFVAIWKRDANAITKPFDTIDNLDYLIIACTTETNYGAFAFPKSALLKHKIISVNGVGGKRGIRVYPRWDTTSNLQAKKTQAWQSKYFIEKPTLSFFL